MARPRKAIPSITHHRPTGQARVRIAGKDFYLGRWGSKEARAAYARLIGEVETLGAETAKTIQAAIAEPQGAEVAELCLAFVEFAKATFRKNGRQTSTLSTFRTPLRILRESYGDLPVKDFSPVALDAVRQQFVKLGMSRRVVNVYTGNLRRVFRWGVSKQLVPVGVVQALECLEPLRAGRTEAHDLAPILPVSDATIDATLPHLPKVVADMVRIQRLTGMRPGEVCSMRPCDVDRAADVWTFRPVEHKTMHKGRSRIVYIGPQAQAVLSRYLLRPADAFCFSAAESCNAMRERRTEERKTPHGRGNGVGDNRRRKPVRSAGFRYDVNSYRRAITRACEDAFGMPEDLSVIPADASDRDERRKRAAAWRAANCWAPNQLRHTFATEARAAGGLEAVQAALGHATIDVTQVYAEKAERLGRDVAARIG